MRNSLFKGLFFLIVAVAIIGAYCKWEIPAIQAIAKPGIMISLAVYLLTMTRGLNRGLKWLCLAAILCSLAGDVFLMLPESDTYFIAGLASFLVAHILYSVAFLSQKVELLEISFIRRNPWFLFVVGLYSFWVWSAIKGGAQGLLIPVTAYVVAIGLMAILAFNRQGKVGSKGYRWVALGALFFIASDSLLARDLFLAPSDHASIGILGTYGIAQLLIVSGMVEQIIDED